MRVAEPPPRSRSARIGGTTESELEALLMLRALRGVGDRAVRTLLEVFGSARAAMSAPQAAFARVVGPAAASARREAGLRDGARQLIRGARERGLHVLTASDPWFPDGLGALHDPPSVLFGAGALHHLASESVTIVGSRRATETGRRTAETLAAGLARAGVVVVSGMALGIDAAAHRGALSVSGATIAVLGGGADRASPNAHRRLYRSIRQHGLVLSELDPGVAPRPHHFPRRNRILAALSRAVVVVEAAERSGALITVDHALDLGRDVYAVPGSVVARESRGTNALIRDGARPVLDAAQLLEELGFQRVSLTRRRPVAAPSIDPGSETYRFWQALDEEPVHVDRIARSLGVDAARALAVLTSLEVEGWACRSPGMRFSRAVDPRSGPRG